MLMQWPEFPIREVLETLTNYFTLELTLTAGPVEIRASPTHEKHLGSFKDLVGERLSLLEASFAKRKRRAHDVDR